MKKKVLLGLLIAAATLLFVSCGDLIGGLKEPYLKYDFYTAESYINGVLVKINKDNVENAKSFVLYYGDEEVTEFDEEIFIPSQPEGIYNTVEGYSICAINKKGSSDKEKLTLYSQGCALDKTHDVVLTQKSEDYNSVTFEWKFEPGDLRFYDYENGKLECLIGESSNQYGMDLLDGECDGNIITYSGIDSTKGLDPASVSSDLYGHLVYSWTDLFGKEHEREDIELVSTNSYKGHTKALDKIENFSVKTSRTSAEVTFTELTNEQLHGLTDCEYLVLVTNKDDTEEKSTVKWLSKDETTGKYSIKELKPETNYKFELFAAKSSEFFEFANMATAEAKTIAALSALKAPTITASGSYDGNLKTSFDVEFEKHPYDTTEHPMEYQVEYYLFKTSSPKTASLEYFKYPTDGKVTISNLNTGNTYKVVLKARDVSDPASVLSTDVQRIKTKVTESGKYELPSECTSSGNTYNWGTMTGTNVKDKNYFKFDVSSLYEYNSPKILVLNADTSSTFKLNNKDTNMGHFEVYVYRPDGEKASTSELTNVTLSSYLTTKSAEYVAYLCGNFIPDLYVYNDSIYLVPEKLYSSLYDSELTDDYNIGITFVTNPSSL